MASGAHTKVDLSTPFQSADFARLLKRAVPCACCGGEDLLQVTTGDRYFFGIETVVCRACGFLFTSPRPDDEWFAEFYRLHYRRYYKSVAAPDAEYVRSDLIQVRHRRTLGLLAPHLGSDGTVLDVGCAEGTFLHLFSARFAGWELRGVEPSEAFSRFAREHYGLTGVITGLVDALEEQESDRLDLVTASHVLEHLLDPNGFFCTARRLLRRDGLLFLEVPDAEGKRRGIHNLHIAHVTHFSERTLGNFLAKHGFKALWFHKGEEEPHPWTLQVLARKEGEPPSVWAPPPADADAIATAFASLCRSSAGTLLLRRLKQRRRERRTRTMSSLPEG
jgi:2-polyprenyl-3-methyl-5-hydroxy-6-metoxy-1,4-benzoquinol methylase